jgi:hypothetical protein
MFLICLSGTYHSCSKLHTHIQRWDEYNLNTFFPFCRLFRWIPHSFLHQLENGINLKTVRNLDTASKFKRALLSNANEINIVPKHRFTQINKSLLLSVYLLHSKKKWYASSRWTPQAQFGLDNIFDLYKSLFRNEAEHGVRYVI